VHHAHHHSLKKILSKGVTVPIQTWSYSSNRLLTPHLTNLIDALDEMQICAVKTYALMDPDKTELKKIGEQ
jgi:hypothetical protein